MVQNAAQARAWAAFCTMPSATLQPQPNAQPASRARASGPSCAGANRGAQNCAECVKHILRATQLGRIASTPGCRPRQHSPATPAIAVTFSDIAAAGTRPRARARAVRSSGTWGALQGDAVQVVAVGSKCAARRLEHTGARARPPRTSRRRVVIGLAAPRPRRHAREFSSASQRRPARAWEARCRPSLPKPRWRRKSAIRTPAGRPVAGPPVRPVCSPKM